MSPAPGTPVPFSRPFKVEEARDGSIDIEVVASAAECAAVAQATAVQAIASLSAKLAVEPGRRGRYRVEGKVRARLTQVCVVTLEAFESDLEEEVEATFAPQEDAERAAARFAARPEDETAASDAEEPPDPIVDGRIDLGALAVEFFVLGLDPYPRKPGVEFDPTLGRTREETETSPFAALAKLKDKDPR